MAEANRDIAHDVPAIEPLERTPSHLQLFLFSAATSNPHRIHYDQAHARTEGYPDVLVQAHLHAAFLVQALMRAVGERAELKRFTFRNRAFSVPGERLVCTGRAVDVMATPEGLRASYVLEERNGRGDICAAAEAVVVFPGGAP